MTRQTKRRSCLQSVIVGPIVPSTIMFFSGSRFPLATLSNMEDHMFCLLPSLLDGRLPGPPECWVPIDIRDPIPTISRKIRPYLAGPVTTEIGLKTSRLFKNVVVGVSSRSFDSRSQSDRQIHDKCSQRKLRGLDNAERRRRTQEFGWTV